MCTDGFQKLLDFAGGSKAKVAKFLGITDAAVSQWRGKVPPKSALLAEAKSGGRITRHDIRPDHFGEPLPRSRRRKAA